MGGRQPDRAASAAMTPTVTGGNLSTRIVIMSRHNAAVQLRAVCPEGARRSASHGTRRRLNVMATITLALGSCDG